MQNKKKTKTKKKRGGANRCWSSPTSCCESLDSALDRFRSWKRPSKDCWSSVAGAAWSCSSWLCMWSIKMVSATSRGATRGQIKISHGNAARRDRARNKCTHRVHMYLENRKVTFSQVFNEKTEISANAILKVSKIEKTPSKQLQLHDWKSAYIHCVELTWTTTQNFCFSKS